MVGSCDLEGAPWGDVRRYPVRKHTSTDLCDIITSIYQSKYYVPEARRSVDGECMWIMDVDVDYGYGFFYGFSLVYRFRERMRMHTASVGRIQHI